MVVVIAALLPDFLLIVRGFTTVPLAGVGSARLLSALVMLQPLLAPLLARLAVDGPPAL